MSTRSIADRLDRAVDDLLSGIRPAADPELAPLVATASRVSGALPVPIPAPRFDARLAARLAYEAASPRGVDRLRVAARQQLRHPRRLIAAGAVSSAALGMTVTLVTVWRTSRRHAHPVRLGHR